MLTDGTDDRFAQCLCMATLTSAAARVADGFVPSGQLSRGQKAGIIGGLFVITLMSNALGVKVSHGIGNDGIHTKSQYSYMDALSG